MATKYKRGDSFFTNEGKRIVIDGIQMIVEEGKEVYDVLVYDGPMWIGNIILDENEIKEATGW